MTAARPVVSVIGGVRAAGQPLTTTVASSLAVLVAAGPSGATTEILAEEFYGEDTPTNWDGQVRMRMWRLRQELKGYGLADRVLNRKGHYFLDFDPEAVDAWRWLFLDEPMDTLIARFSLHGLLRGEPFAQVAATPTVRHVRNQLIARQVDAVRFSVAQRDVERLRPVLPLVRSLAERSEFDDDAPTAAAIAHALCGSEATAHRLVADYERTLEAEGLPPSSAPAVALNDFIQTERSPAAPASGLGSPPARLIGRRRHLEQILQGGVSASDPRSFLVIGEEGSGRSALLRAASAELVRAGCVVRAVAGSAMGKGSYLPFVAAVPELGELVEDLGDVDTPARQAARHVAILRTLCELQPRAPVVVLVDDGDLLDTQSLLFCDYAVRAGRSHGVSLVLAGSGTSDQQTWQDLVVSVRRVGAEELVLEGLDRSELEHWVRSRFPNTSPALRRRAASELLRRTSGTPALVSQLLDTAEPETLIFGAIANSRPRFALTDLAPDARRAAAAAAIWGMAFTAEQVARLIGADQDEVAAAIDDLVEHSIVIEQPHSNVVTFRDGSVHSESLDLVSRALLRRWHQVAAGLTEHHGDRALHLAAAVPNVAAEEAIMALVESARVFFDEFAYHEAVGQLRLALTIGRDSDLGAQTLGMYATALDRMGANGTRVRQRAVERAIAEGDQTLALRVAIDGLPHTESTDGDAPRVELLLKCDPSSLARGDRFAHAQHLSRQLALLGRGVEAEVWAKTAAAAAVSADDHAAVWLERWALGVPRSCLDAPPNVSEVVDPVLSARLAQAEALEAYRRGPIADAEPLVEGFVALATAAGEPLRLWHALILDALRMALRGDRSASVAAAERARAFAFDHGLAQGELGMVAFLTLEAWRNGELSDWPTGTAPAEDGSHLERSGWLILEACRDGHSAELFSRTSELVEEVLAHPNMFTSAIVALLAEIVGADPDGRDLAEACDAFLAPLDPGHVIVGAGVGHLGPVSRARAHLAQRVEERQRLFQRALDEARSWGLVPWIQPLERLRNYAESRDYQQYRPEGESL